MKVVDGLLGDVVTETLPALIYQTCDGKLDAIKELVLNKFRVTSRSGTLP